PGQDVPIRREVRRVDQHPPAARASRDRRRAQLVEIGRGGVLDQGLTWRRAEGGTAEQVARGLRLVDPVRPAVHEFIAPLTGHDVSERGHRGQWQPSERVPVEVTDLGIADVELVAVLGQRIRRVERLSPRAIRRAHAWITRPKASLYSISSWGVKSRKTWALESNSSVGKIHSLAASSGSVFANTS